MPGEVFALLSAFFFAVANIFLRRGMERRPGDNGLLMSCLVNLLLYSLLVVVYAASGAIPAPKREGIALFILAGVLTALLGRASTLASIRWIGPSRASAFKVSAPLFTMAVAYVAVGERIGWWGFLGALLVLGGVWWLSFETHALGDRLHTRGDGGEGAGAGGAGQAIRQGGAVAGMVARPQAAALLGVSPGVIFGILSAFLYGTGYVARKAGLAHWDSALMGVWIGAAVALLALLAQAALQGRLRERLRANFRPICWPFVMGGVMTSLAQFSIFAAIARTEVTFASVVQSVEPLMLIGLSLAFLGRSEQINVRVVGSAALISAGVAVILAL